MSTAKSMWGDLSDLETVRTPKAILVEQAIFLTKATSNVLVGDVKDVRRSATENLPAAHRGWFNSDVVFG